MTRSIDEIVKRLREISENGENDQNVVERAQAVALAEYTHEIGIERAICRVKAEISSFSESDRQLVLNKVLGDLNSKLSVR